MATEERLIKASTLLKAIDPDKVTWRFGVPDTLDTMVDFLRIIINEQPAVDAVEVVHSRWLSLEEYSKKIGATVEDDTYSGWIYCSECGQPSRSFNNWNYCPNCGTKMDGG